MIVYVESNFVLEHALGQEQHASCERLMQWSVDGKIELAVPAHSLMEPFDTLTRRRLERKQLKVELDKVTSQLGRSSVYTTEVAAIGVLSNTLLVESAQRDSQQYADIRQRLLNLAIIIPLDALALQAALQYQSSYDLSAPDAVVYASIVMHLEHHRPDQSVFLNRNSKDFNDPDILAELDSYGCKTMFSFNDGMEYVGSRL